MLYIVVYNAQKQNGLQANALLSGVIKAGRKKWIDLCPGGPGVMMMTQEGAPQCSVGTRYFTPQIASDSRAELMALLQTVTKLSRHTLDIAAFTRL